MSLKTGRYYTLTGTGAAAWLLLCDGTRSADVAGIPDTDVRALAASLSTAGLIESTDNPADRLRSSAKAAVSAAIPRARADDDRSACQDSDDDPRQVPSHGICLAALVAFHLLLKVCRLRSVIARAYVRLPSHPRTAGRAWNREVTRRLELAAAIYPFRADCLERSLACVWLARHAGFDATLRLGVSPLPFEAHAWAECDGRTVNELEEGVARFTRFPPLSADWLGGAL
jgi:hypothetical protein